MPNRDLSKLIGIPFADGGRDLSGCDCWGLVRLVFAAYDIEVQDYKIGCFDTAQINEQVDKARAEWVRIDRPQEPCLMVMRTNSDLPLFCNHLGVYVGDGRMIHTFQKRNSVIERINNGYWNRKVEGYYVPIPKT